MKKKNIKWFEMFACYYAKVLAKQMQRGSCRVFGQYWKYCVTPLILIIVE